MPPNEHAVPNRGLVGGIFARFRRPMGAMIRSFVSYRHTGGDVYRHTVLWGILGPSAVVIGGALGGRPTYALGADAYE